MHEESARNNSKHRKAIYDFEARIQVNSHPYCRACPRGNCGVICSSSGSDHLYSQGLLRLPQHLWWQPQPRQHDRASFLCQRQHSYFVELQGRYGSDWAARYSGFDGPDWAARYSGFDGPDWAARYSGFDGPDWFDWTTGSARTDRQCWATGLEGRHWSHRCTRRHWSHRRKRRHWSHRCKSP